jgi:5-methylcytosine-specific restriction protein A
VKLRTLKPTLRTLGSAQRVAPTPSENRIAGAQNQRRRWRLWQANPHCAMCGRLMDWPYGCEADHVVRLDEGGRDTEANLWLLCVWWERDGSKQGCHADKTAEEVSRRGGR